MQTEQQTLIIHATTQVIAAKDEAVETSFTMPTKGFPMHSLDGLSLDALVVTSTITSREEAQRIIDFLTCAKYCFNG
jgi:hypothetical protein